MARRDPKFCQETREKVRKWQDYWKYNINQYHEFMAFVMGDQWEDDEAKLMENYNKIPLTFNKLGALMNHLLGEQRQNTPNLQIVPDANVPEQTAEIRSALIKDITLSSSAKIIYQTAFQQAAIGGFGAYGVLTEYEDNYTFDQVIRFFGVKDPTRCYWDISAESPCKTDGMYCGYMKRMSREKVRQLYGAKIERTMATTSEDDTELSFSDDDSITFLNHYVRKYKVEKLFSVVNEHGEYQTLTQEQYDTAEEMQDDNGEDILVYNNEIVYIKDKRDVPKYTIKHYLIGGDYVLEEEEFPSEQLPLIFVDQNSWWDKRGKQVCRPFVKDARDAQRFINYIGTNSAYIMKVSRYDQFMVSKENIKSADTEAAWRDPCTYLGGLWYDESPSGAIPQRLTPPELPASFLSQYQRCLQDIHTSTGLYDTQLGEQGNEISGAAIDARTKRGSYNTFVPFDSLNRAIACGGEIVNEMIPKVYDSERLMMLYLQDEGIKPVKINEQVNEYGIMQNSMKEGRFKVRLMPGPSTEGQKAEALESMNILLTADKSGQIFPLIADLYVANLPVPNNIELKNRLKTIVPPEIIQAGKTGQPPQPKQQQPSPEAQAQMALAQAKLQDIELKKAEIQRKAQEMQIKAQQEQQKMAMEQEQLDAERIEIAAKLQEQLMRYAAETHRTNTDEQMAHADNLVKILTHSPKFHENKREA